MLILHIRSDKDFQSTLKGYDFAQHTSRIIFMAKKSAEKYTKVDEKKHAEKFIRAGFVVSKKIDKRAVGRNKIKRRFREALKKIIDENQEIADKFNHMDIVIVARKFVTEADYQDVINDIKSCLLGEARKGAPERKKFNNSKKK